MSDKSDSEPGNLYMEDIQRVVNMMAFIKDRLSFILLSSTAHRVPFVTR